MTHPRSFFTAVRPLIGAAAVVALMTAAFADGAAAAPTPIYKCFDRNLALVYTDLPCKGGEELDIRPGNADPAALARLDQERNALARSSEQRIADMRHAQLQRQQFAAMPDYGPGYADGYAPGFGGGYWDGGGFYPYGFGVGIESPRNRQRTEAKVDRSNVRRSAVPSRMGSPKR